MADKRKPGPLGTTDSELPVATSLGSPPNRHMTSPSPHGQLGLTEEERDLLLDLGQLTLDLIGIVEPTPFADSANAAISVARGDYGGAALSGLGIIPFLGDLAKVGKLPRYAEKLRRALGLARNNARFAEAIRPILIRLRQLLDSIPVEALGTEPRRWVNSLKRPLDDFLGSAGGIAHRGSKLDQLVDRLLIARLGSAANVGTLVRENVAKIAELLTKHKIPEAKMLDVLSGIDLHSPVRVRRLMKGDRLVQAVQNDKVGAWFVKAGGGVGPESTGVARGYDEFTRQNKHFEVTRTVEVIDSRAANVIDHWTAGGAPARLGAGVQRVPGKSVVVDPKTNRIEKADDGLLHYKKNSKYNRYGVTASGGGRQIYIPALETGVPGQTFDAWARYLKLTR